MSSSSSSSLFSISVNPKPFLLISPPFLSNSRKPPASSLTRCCVPPGREDLLWLREEQRWLREEQRWLREEQRWARERESLLGEIRSLKLRVQSLERRRGGVDEEDHVIPLLEVVAEKDLIPESGGAMAGPMLLEEGVVSVSLGEVAEDKAAVEVKEKKKKKKKKKKEEGERKTLRVGNEGEEVREMQEALQKLGFYSGEEDMEFSSFSTGTQRAVKTWQATLGVTEDGIMTAELLKMLFAEQEEEISQPTQIANQKATTPTVSEKQGVNGAVFGANSGIKEVKKKVVKEEDKTEDEASHHRVYLLGENRWEDSSRLSRQDKAVGDSKTKNATTKCLTCRGEGRLLCLECDGTGEPNIEPQFMEWIDEGEKCPYCEGLGYTICDVCGEEAIN